MFTLSFKTSDKERTKDEVIVVNLANCNYSNDRLIEPQELHKQRRCKKIVETTN